MYWSVWVLLSFLGSEPSTTREQTWFLESAQAPLTVIVFVPYATIEVVAGTSNKVHMMLTGGPAATLVGMAELGERKLSLNAPGNANLVNLRLEVPKRTHLSLRSDNGGTITVRGVVGNMDLQNSNGNVVLDEVGGALLVATSNGYIEGTVTEVVPDTPMSFLTSNHRINLQFPQDLKAVFHLESDNGTLETSFPLTPTSPPAKFRGNLPSHGHTRLLYGRVNGGGPLYRFATTNGNITIRRAP